MTQIRGRIKTIVDYNTLNVGLGVCCKADGTKHDELKSLNECNKHVHSPVKEDVVVLVRTPQKIQEHPRIGHIQVTTQLSQLEDLDLLTV